MPWTRTVPSGSAVQACAAPPLHSCRSIGLPELVPFPASSRQLPGICDTTGPAGSVHFWFARPVHDQTCAATPLAALEPVSSRHRPETGSTRSAAVPARHCWLVAPEQVCSTIFEPFAVPDPATDRHLLWIRSVWSWAMVQFWELPPLHDQIWIFVPSALLLPVSSRHFPARSRCTGPVGPMPGAAVTVQGNEADPETLSGAVTVTVTWWAPAGDAGQPVISPWLLIDKAPGRAAAEYDMVCPAAESAAFTCRSTGWPATVFKAPGDVTVTWPRMSQVKRTDPVAAPAVAVAVTW